MKLHPIHLNHTIETERPISLTRRDLRKLEQVAEHCRQSGTPLHWMIREVALQRLHETHRKRPWWAPYSVEVTMTENLGDGVYAYLMDVG
jgi:hypothetical protein